MSVYYITEFTIYSLEYTTPYGLCIIPPFFGEECRHSYFLHVPSLHLVFVFHSRSYLEGLCTTLYDVLRPFIIHINHLETLAEVCSILRLEMLEEHVQNNRKYTTLFGRYGYSMCTLKNSV